MNNYEEYVVVSQCLVLWVWPVFIRFHCSNHCNCSTTPLVRWRSLWPTCHRSPLSQSSFLNLKVDDVRLSQIFGRVICLDMFVSAWWGRKHAIALFSLPAQHLHDRHQHPADDPAGWRSPSRSFALSHLRRASALQRPDPALKILVALLHLQERAANPLHFPVRLLDELLGGLPLGHPG